MKPGQRIELGKGEWITCRRTAADGGAFEFDLELDPGVDGPPVHHHPDEETFEVVDGRIEFVVNGEVRVLEKGESVVIPAGTPHTFRVPRGSGGLRGIGRNGGRFERLVDQHVGNAQFPRMARYLVEVDPHASYMVSPVVRSLLALVALVARLTGIKPYPAEGPVSTEEP